MLKNIILMATILFVAAIYAEEKNIDTKLKIEKYEIIPGNFFKAEGFGTRFDNDLDKDGARKGLLTNGIRHETTTVVCYNFWRVDEKDCYIAFKMELEKEANITKVVACGFNHTEAYAPTKYRLESKVDNLDVNPVVVKEGDIDPKIFTPSGWVLEIPVNIKTRILTLTIYAKGNGYLNVTELEIYGNR